MDLVPQKFAETKPMALTLASAMLPTKLQTSSTMNNQSRINLLKEVKTAVNTASFAPTTDRIEDAKKAVASLMSYVESLEAPKPKRKRRKAKGKSGKATSATKVADRQERQFHGKADGVVTPCHTKRTASVEEARKSAQEVSDKSGATARANRKAELVKEAVVMPKAAPMEVTSHDDRVASLEAKIEALTAIIAEGLMSPDVTSTANEVCFSDLPFDPTL